MIRVQFADAIICIFVGPEQVLFKVSKQLLCTHSDYCQAALTGNFKEGQAGIIRLEDVDPEIFKAFVKWLYCISLSQVEVLAKPDRWNWYLDLYILADRLCAYKLQNRVIDAMIGMAKVKKLTFTATLETWDRIPPGCKLRDFLLDLAMQQALIEPQTDITEVEDTVTGKDFLAEFGKRCLLTYLHPGRHWIISATDEAQRCKQYHVHRTDKSGRKGDSPVCP